jgi:hypothetical protein
MAGFTNKIVNFQNVSSFLPFKLPNQFTHVNPQTTPKAIPFHVDGSDTVVTPAVKTKEELSKLAEKHGELIKAGRCNYNKKVGIIYNPNSGKKRDVRAEII